MGLEQPCREVVIRQFCGPRSDPRGCSTLAVDIKGQLKSLSHSFDGYFLNLSVDSWIQDPFTILTDNIDDDKDFKTDIIELKASGLLKILSTVSGSLEFWAINYKDCPNLGVQAIRMVLLFVAT